MVVGLTADIRDKAAALAAYARQRDDKDMECWVREIHLRACVRIGELVRELDRAEPGGAIDGERGGSTVQPDALSKDDAIADAGLSRRSAYDYQALAGGRDERAQAAGKAASENYYAQSRAKSEPPTMAGLRAAVREAVVATVGQPPTRARPEPIEPVQPIGGAWGGSRVLGALPRSTVICTPWCFPRYRWPKGVAGCRSCRMLLKLHIFSGN